MERLSRQKMIDAAEFFYTSPDEARSEVALYHLRKAVPHVLITEMMHKDYGIKPLEQIVDEALLLEAERASRCPRLSVMKI